MRKRQVKKYIKIMPCMGFAEGQEWVLCGWDIPARYKRPKYKQLLKVMGLI